MQNITSFLVFMYRDLLFPVESRQFFVHPNRGKRKECGNQRKHKILIIPFEYFSCWQKQKQIKCEEKSVDISHNDNINRGRKCITVIANPNHCRKQQTPGNRLQQANLLKPFDDFFFRIF